MARSRELPADDLAGLLRQWSDAQLAALDALDRPVEAVARTGSLLLPPATEAQVADAEKRLGVRLPGSYRDFLLLSNGAYGDTIGAVMAVDPRAGGSDAGLGFLPVTEISWFIEVEPETVEIWLASQDEIEETRGVPDPAPTFERDEVRDYRPLRDALLIARGFDANCSLLVPVGGPGEEWEVWDHYKEGTTRWSSFRAYVRDTVEDHLGVDVDEAEALLLLASAEEGDLQAVQRVGRVRSPVATELLLDAARRGVVPHPVMRALTRIGGPDVVAALTDLRLNEWQQSYAHRALALIGTPDALDHLASVGAYLQLSQVGDRRAAEIAAARLRDGDYTTQLAAAHVLARMPDPRWVPDLLGAYDRATSDGLRVSTLGALEACGAFEEARRRAPDLLDGPYGYAAQAILIRLSGRTGGIEPHTP
ncbi:SMI1/KNR4 family protein [Nocardioides astragali]|uniref:SMI1/KNR4 family protein n=1 Tax=Nocardioides astragali TaxID=1776736 RepID=A0ABW2N1N6_9ACTN|nr:SMI1/KNR4 family protein [Nocardioides astragali]